MKRTIVLVLAVLATGCSFWLPAEPSTDDVRAALEALGAAERAGAVPLVLGAFADDAVLVPASGPPLEGLAAIAEHYRLLVAEQKLDTAVIIDRIGAEGDLAWASGRTTGYQQSRRTGVDRRVDDRWLMVLERQEGEWRIVRMLVRPSSP
ncbi:MAG: YybH family protein [Thermoanaerobaculia bacterium]